MGSERGDGFKRPCLLGEGTGSKEPGDREAPQRATASRPVPTHQYISNYDCDSEDPWHLRRSSIEPPAVYQLPELPCAA
jgi:hypothetical protein